mmetsp:Transcript_26854/g.57564  ORF Transcript_26854/g.57564 Transcript_26854/m.57564 type:complete len:460 (+) Transcript_26854:146-1525(+)
MAADCLSDYLWFKHGNRRIQNRDVVVADASVFNERLTIHQFLLDQDDYYAMLEIGSLSHKTRGGLFLYRKIRGWIEKVDDNGVAYKIVRVQYTGRCNKQKEPVPTTIANFAHLRHLTIAETDIPFVPKEIFKRCKNLRVLDLSDTWKLKKLPDEIGDAVELHTLNLRRSGIESMPDVSVLARLMNLKILCLGDTKNLELEDCASASDSTQPTSTLSKESFPRLVELDLRHSKLLEGFPAPRLSTDPTWRRFFLSTDLRNLSLRGAKGLASLPDSIQGMARLEKLDVSFTGLASLPEPSFFAGLVRLRVLDIGGTPVLETYSRQMTTSETRTMPTEDGERRSIHPLYNLVVNGCRGPLIGCIGLEEWQENESAHYRELGRSLARNRMFSRTPGSIGALPLSLWPQLLLATRARRLFRPYKSCTEGCSCRLPSEEDALFTVMSNFGCSIIPCGGNGTEPHR